MSLKPLPLIRAPLLGVTFLIIFSSCARPRFTDFRGEDLGATANTLTRGRQLAEKYCGTCHLTPLPESMSQDNAAFVLAYMGLFHGIDASRKLDDSERAQFKQRFELLKKTGAIPKAPQVTPADWAALRAYYLGLARYPFASSENAEEPGIHPVPFGDQGVTLVKAIPEGFAVGGGLSGLLQFFSRDLKPVFSVQLDSPPVHIEAARDATTPGGYYVLTLGSLLGALSDENKAALYRVDTKTKTARKIIPGLMRSGHFLTLDTNGDGTADFLIAGFGAVTGGGVFLFESGPSGYARKSLSGRGSIVRLALLSNNPGRTEFLALAGGAREALLHISYARGEAQEKILAEFPPHLGSVWLEYADIDGDGKAEVLVLSGDNADSGPYNEAKPDQGLRIYSFDSGQLTQRHFESLPGALSLAISGRSIAVSRFYTAPESRQDLTILTHKKENRFERRHFTLPSRPTVLAAVQEGFLIGSGNIPIASRTMQREFQGPVLFTTDLKMGNP